MNKIKRYTKSLKNHKNQKASLDPLFSCLTLSKKTKSYEVIENINLKKSNIEIENQRKIEIRYMFLLKTLGILTKHCKKTLQESTLSKTSLPDRNIIRCSQKLRGEKEETGSF